MIDNTCYKIIIAFLIIKKDAAL